MWALVIVGFVMTFVVAAAVVGARRGTEQVTTYGDPNIERERARGVGTGDHF